MDYGGAGPEGCPYVGTAREVSDVAPWRSAGVRMTKRTQFGWVGVRRTYDDCRLGFVGFRKKTNSAENERLLGFGPENAGTYPRTQGRDIADAGMGRIDSRDGTHITYTHDTPEFRVPKN
jgi:hypothetical protein